MNKLFFALGIGLTAGLAHAKPAAFPDPIRYESSGYVWSAKSFPYADMKKHLGKPMSETGECAWGYVEYPSITFYDTDETPKKVLFASMKFTSAKDKVVFPNFVVDHNTTLGSLHKYKPRLIEKSAQFAEYIIDIHPAKDADDYGYMFKFKKDQLIEFSNWQQIC